MSSATLVRNAKKSVASKPNEVFGWKSGARLKAKAEEAAKVLKQIHKQEPLTPQALVRHAVDTASPLHNDFTWDNNEAAEKYREDQGRLILRSLVVCYKRDDDSYSEPIRYTVKVTRDEDEKEDIYETIALKSHVYVPLREAMADPDNRHRVMQRALSDFVSLRKKYAEYEEFARIFEEIDRLVESGPMSIAS